MAIHGPRSTRLLVPRSSIMAVVLFRKQEELTVAEAKQLLTQPDLTKASYVPPVKPKAGEVYLFSPGK